MKNKAKEQYQMIGFFILLIIFGIASFLATKAYIGMFFIAFIVTIIMHPIYKWLEQKIKIKILASFLTMVTFLIVLVIPITLVTIIAINQGMTLINEILAYLQNNPIDITQNLNSILENLIPTIKSSVENGTININKTLLNILTSTLSVVSSSAIYIFTHGAFLLINFGIFLLFLTFFFPEKEKLIIILKKIIPLNEKESNDFIEKFTAITEKLSVSVIVVPIIQGTLMWFIFFLLEIPGAVFWGVITGIVSLIPAIGTTLIWIPTSIIFLSKAIWLKGIIILLYGLIIMNFSDNVTRAWILKGKKTQIPELVTLLSSIGGLFAFGFFGIFYGPIIVITFLALLDIYKKRIAN